MLSHPVLMRLMCPFLARFQALGPLPRSTFVHLLLIAAMLPMKSLLDAASGRLRSRSRSNEFDHSKLVIAGVLRYDGIFGSSSFFVNLAAPSHQASFKVLYGLLMRG